MEIVKEAPAKEHQHYPLPDRMTQAGWDFQREHFRILAFVVFVTQLAQSTDEKAKIAAKALYESQDEEKYRSILKRIEDHGAAPSLRTLHRPLVLEMMLCRGAENFLAYVSQLIAAIFRTRPETLRSAETVRLDELLKHSTMNDLIASLADRRVNQLSYQGMRDLSAYLHERLGFEVFTAAEELERAIRVIESRNIIVHNRGIVNATFIALTKDNVSKINSRISLATGQVFDDLDFLELSMHAIDKRAADKFGLAIIPRPAPDELGDA